LASGDTRHGWNILKQNQSVAKSLSSLAKASNTSTALLFANLVRPGGLWDYKNTDVQKGNIFGMTAQYEKETDKKTSFTSGKLNFVEGGSDIGNFNYGYTGRYVGADGYNHSILWGAGGALQISKDFLRLNWGKAFDEFNSVTPISRPPFGDENDDFIWTTLGMKQADDEKKDNNN
jgi:Bacterial toxin 44